LRDSSSWAVLLCVLFVLVVFPSIFSFSLTKRIFPNFNNALPLRRWSCFFFVRFTPFFWSLPGPGHPICFSGELFFSEYLWRIFTHACLMSFRLTFAGDLSTSCGDVLVLLRAKCFFPFPFFEDPPVPLLKIPDVRVLFNLYFLDPQIAFPRIWRNIRRFIAGSTPLVVFPRL